ncbi:MAG: hypothetical protein JWM99_2642, partial [Verrucomicrobiales bacterium]|nr:hypothetical protein [Verrucomicrobiales bacterium]
MERHRMKFMMVIATAAIGLIAYLAWRWAKLRSEIVTLKREIAIAAEQIQQVSRERDESTSKMKVACHGCHQHVDSDHGLLQGMVGVAWIRSCVPQLYAVPGSNARDMASTLTIKAQHASRRSQVKQTSELRKRMTPQLAPMSRAA